MKINYWKRSHQWMTALALSGVLWIPGHAMAMAPQDVVPQTCDAVEASPYEEPLPGETFLPESLTQMLNGERFQVASDSDEYLGQICHTQLLAEGPDYKEYQIQCGLFQTLLWVGPSGKLIMDAGGHNSSFPPIVNGQLQPGGAELEKLLTIIESIEPGKPIKALVPSHPHQDHVGNLLNIKQMYPEARVIVSKWFLREAKKKGYPLVQPLVEIPGFTVIHARDGSFNFDGYEFGLHTPVPVAHTPADSILITPGKSCMLVDILQPGRLAFVNLSVVQNVDGMVEILNYIGGLAEAGVCTQGVWGHMNASTGPSVLADIGRAKEYLFDLHLAFWQAFGSLQAEGKFADAFFPDNLEDEPNNPGDPHDFHAHVGISRLFDEVALRMHGFLKDKYFAQIGFSAHRTTIKELLRFVFLHRLSAAAVDPNAPPGSLPPYAFPSFDNVPAGDLLYDRFW